MADTPIANGNDAVVPPVQPSEQPGEDKGDLNVALHQARQEKAATAEELAQAKAEVEQLRQQLEQAANSGLSEEERFEKELQEHSLSIIKQSVGEKLDAIPGALGQRFKNDPFSVVAESERKLIETTSTSKVEAYQKLTKAAIGEIESLSQSFATVTPPSEPAPGGGTPTAETPQPQGETMSPYAIAKAMMEDPNFVGETLKRNL